MSTAVQACIDWYAPRQEWNPIHARVDPSSEWYSAQLERSEFLRDADHHAQMPVRRNGIVAQALVRVLIPGMITIDDYSTDLYHGDHTYDVVSGTVTGMPSPSQDIIIPHKKEKKQFPPDRFYAVRVNHPDYWLIGWVEYRRFWHLCKRDPPWSNNHHPDDGYLGFEHFTQIPLPDSFNPPPAIQVFGQGLGAR